MITTFRAGRLAAITLILAAVATDAYSAIDSGTFAFFNFFGYFSRSKRISSPLLC